MSDIETWSIDKGSYKESLHNKYAENMHQKLVQDLYLTLEYSPNYNWCIQKLFNK